LNKKKQALKQFIKQSFSSFLPARIKLIGKSMSNNGGFIFPTALDIGIITAI